MKTSRTLAKFGAVAAALTLGLTACGGGNSQDATSTDIKTVKIGVTDGAEPYWQVYKSKVKEKTGVDVEFQNFSDYNQPNPALEQGALQMNEFQHLQYLANYNVKNNKSLQPIEATAVYPLPLYSEKYRSVDEIPKGAQIAIPNDPVNQARAISVLEQAGLVKVKGEVNTTTTPANIDTGASQVKVVPMDAKQTAQQVKSLAGAVVNNNFATSAHLSDDLIIAKDNPNAEATKPYINVFVVRDQDKDNETLKKVADVYHDPEVEKAIRKDLGPNGVFKKNSAEDLQSTLEKIQSDIKSGSK